MRIILKNRLLLWIATVTIGIVGFPAITAMAWGADARQAAAFGGTSNSELFLQDQRDPRPDDPDAPKTDPVEDDDEEINEQPMGDEPTEAPIPSAKRPNPRERIDRTRNVRTRAAKEKAARPVNRAAREDTPDNEVANADGPADLVAFDIEVEDRPLGRIIIELNLESVPRTAKNFLDYVDAGYYNNTIFHRIIEGFIVQGGGFTALDQPKSDGLRAPIKNEAERLVRHNRGTIAAAHIHRKHDTATSQFFINLDNNTRLDRQKYCVFGRVVEGMEIVDRLGVAPTEAGDVEGPRYLTKPVIAPKLTRAYRYKGKVKGREARSSTTAKRAARKRPARQDSTADRDEIEIAERNFDRSSNGSAVDEVLSQPGSDAHSTIPARVDRETMENAKKLVRDQRRDDDESTVDDGDDWTPAEQKMIREMLEKNPDATDKEIEDFEMLLRMKRQMDSEQSENAKPVTPGQRTTGSKAKDRERKAKPIAKKKPKSKGGRSRD